jgi:hypothetical protein
MIVSPDDPIVFTAAGQDKTITLENVGGSGSVTVSSFIGYAVGTGYGTAVNMCAGASLAPGETCSFVVRRSFGSDGAANDTVTVLTSAGNPSRRLQFTPSS